MIGLSNSHFPTLPTPTSAQWAPVLFRPILGSPEQYVIAVAAVNKGGFHIEAANQWSRLNCLFGTNSATLVMVAQAALKQLESDIAAKGLSALSHYRHVAASICLGEIREGQASSVQEVAQVWMRHLSSLYSTGSLAAADAAKELISVELAGESDKKHKENLPELVMEAVSVSNPALRAYFSQPKKKTYDVHIDFSGKRTVANFETLTTAGFAASVARIKHRMWDLKVSRDAPNRKGAIRLHQMFVKHKAKTEMNDSQIEKIEGAIKGLEQQADQEHIRLLSLTSVADISSRLAIEELTA